MLHGKNPRLDGRRTASSYCSTLTIVVFVALCLIGVWMMTSSALIPFGNLNLLVPGDANGQIIKKDSLQFEDQPRVSEEIDKEIAENVQEDNFDKESQRGNNFLDDNQSENKEGKKEGRDREEWSVTDDEQEAKKDFHENLTEYQSEQSSASEKKGHVEEKVDESQERRSENNPGEVFPYGTELEFFNDTNTKNGSWSTQDIESKNEKKRRESSSSKTLADASKYSYSWKICNSSAGPDYIPCLDNEEVIRKLPSTKHYEHRERHCPDEPPTCLTPLPEGYKQSIKWPQSRDQVWYSNVPHTKLAEVKGHQNWVKVTGEYLTFPGGGTQFKHGALHYIDFIQEMMPNIMWGKKSRVLLDVGCGVASFGGYLFERDVLAMSFAPKDEHEAQVQFALERGIPAISSVMGTKRLPFPSKVFDVVHCARCRVPWHVEGGMLLLELNRLLRPGGYFIWSATPIYQKLPEDVEIWKAMSSLTKSICWKMISVKRDTLNQVGIAIFQKPNSNKCYDQRTKNNPSLCPEYDDPDAAWNVSLQACMHRVPTKESLRGSKWPEHWPARLDKVPYWLNASQTGVYGKAAPEDFIQDYQNWKRIVQNSYLKGMGINWSNVRNVMDMRSIYGGFAAAMREMNVWVMNVVPIDSADTLSIIYERGLFGIYHDWCESFSTYPRTYDLLHADHLFSKSQKRCKLEAVMAEADRILRPKGNLIVRDGVDIIGKIKDIAKSLHWEVQFIYSKQKEGLLCVQKTTWRPQLFDLSS